MVKMRERGDQTKKQKKDKKQNKKTKRNPLFYFFFEGY
jgi:hypothetical protein